MIAPAVREDCPQTSSVRLPQLFWEWFKIALFVVGGGYAIIVVADEVFGRKLGWIREGELLALTPEDFEGKMQTPVVIDGRNCFVPDRFIGTGVTYESIGRKPVRNHAERTDVQ